MSESSSHSFPPSLRRGGISRRQAIALAASASAWPAASRAEEFRVEISGVGETQVPIALPRFRNEEVAPVTIPAVVRADLVRSGLFRITDTGSTAFDDATRPVFNDWRAKGTDALLGGSVSRLADGRFDVRYRLWDIVRSSEIAGQSMAVGRDDLRQAAHRIADDIFRRLTGEYGVFSTRIAYVAKAGLQYSLYIADADGEGAQVAVSSVEPIISPSWSPDGREIAYVSFETRKAVVWSQDIATGKRRQMANYRGSNSAPAWSPDGRQMAVTLSRDGLSQIYLIGRNGGEVQRLTQSGGIDTEACWAPDGKSLYFVSDRGGSPQIYRQTLGGGAVERITFEGNYNISPDASPDGRYLAFINRQGNVFKLMLLDFNTGAITPLTDTVDDESPSFAPNSRMIMYATRVGGREVLMTTSLDGRIKSRLGASQADVREPVWGPSLK